MTTPTKVLFLCNGGIRRSPLGVEVLSEMLAESRSLESVEATSTGILRYYAKPDGALARDLAQFDRIFVMERCVLSKLITRHGVPSEKVSNLDIPDHYDITDPEQEDRLRRILRNKLARYLPQLINH